MIILVQTTEAEATTQMNALNAQFVSAEISGTLQAVIAQVDNWAMAEIPTARVVEFNASDSEKKNNFLKFTSLARSEQNAGTDFVTAWEAEYAKVYP